MTTRDVLDAAPRSVHTERSGSERAVCVVVPVTERPEPLNRIYEAYAPALLSLGRSFEFLFVIEPWGRDMVSALEPVIEAGGPVRILEMGQVASEAALLRAAVEHTRAPLILTVPPYHRVEPSSIPELIETVEEGADLASACRDRTDDSWLNRLQSRVFHALLALSGGGRFRDVASGVRAMRREVLEEVPLYGDFFRFLPLLARREGFRVDEVPLPQHPLDSESRVYAPGIYLRRLIDLLGVVFLMRFTQKPLRFFGLVGSGLAAAGAAILGVLFVQRLGGTGIADRPLLLLGVLLAVLGVQALALGLIGEVIVHLHASRHALYRVRGDGNRP